MLDARDPCRRRVIAVVTVLSGCGLFSHRPAAAEDLYPYEGPFEADPIPMEWNLFSGGKVFQLEIQAPDIRNGEVINTTIIPVVPYTFDYVGFIANGMETRVRDEWKLNLPDLDYSAPFFGEAAAICPGGCAPNTPFSFRPLTLSPLTFISNLPETRFDINNPDAYEPKGVHSTDNPLEMKDGKPIIKGNFTLISSTQVTGVAALYQHNTTNPNPLFINHDIRPWTTEDALAGRMKQTNHWNTMMIQVNEPRRTPKFTGDVGMVNFDFTLEEAIQLSDFDNLNYEQRFTGFWEWNPQQKQAVRNDPAFVAFTFNHHAIGGTRDIDPSPINPNPILNPDADTFSPYWDQTVAAIPGRADKHWDHPGNQMGAHFDDQPNLIFRGYQLAFETKMGGWKNATQSFTPFSHPSYTFKWIWKQTRDDPCVSQGNCGVGDIIPQGATDPTSFHGVAFAFGTGAWTEEELEAAGALVAAWEPIPGDYNLDGMVDSADYTVWRDNLGDEQLLYADGSGDGRVGPEDYLVWRNNYGASNPLPGAAELAAAISSVPEPTALTVAWVLTAFTLTANPRRRTPDATV